MWSFVKLVLHVIMGWTLALIASSWVGNTPGFRGTPYPDIVAIFIGITYFILWYINASKKYKRRIRFIQEKVVPKDFNPTVEIYGNGGKYYFAFNKPRNELVFYDKMKNIKLVKSGDYLRGYEVESPVTKSGRYYDSVIKLKFDDMEMPFVKFYIDPPELEKKIAQLDLVLNG